MDDGVSVRPLTAEDLEPYKALRDETLALHPDAFTSDAETERQKPASNYFARFGPAQPGDGPFTLGAWQGPRLVGAITCEHDGRRKVRHIGHVVGMMVCADARGHGVGRALLDACIARARETDGLELLTLSVTSSNVAAVRLYERAGFERYGRLPRAIKLADTYHGKDLMVLALRP
jgi:ribosomal protein S18 acetylase RimI-like enzyme